MHVGSVLISIQSLLCNNPLHNEPGFENEVGYRNNTYNMIVEYDTFQNLIINNCFKIPELFSQFKEIIQEHIVKEKENIISRIDQLVIKYPQRNKVSLNIYNLSLLIDYPRIKEILSDKLS
jgi:hypothetical protein